MENFINSAAYMAHGYCLLWKPWLVALHAGSDALIVASYFAIPTAILIFLNRRRDLELKPLGYFFATFVFLCGLTHLAQIVTLWWPVYEAQAFLKLATGLVSLTTAIVIFPLIPKALAIPSPRALEAANAELKAARDMLEERVAERTRELETAKARVEALIRASAHIFWTTSPEGKVVADSPSWRAFTGQSKEEWLAQGWLQALHPDDRTRAKDAWDAAVAAGEMFEVDYRVRDAQGEYHWTTARAVPMREEGGAVREWVGMNEDITERKRDEEHLRLLMQELSHRTKNLLAVVSAIARKTFATNSEHELKAFMERLQGMILSHDLLVRGQWRGAALRDLIRSHLEPFGAAGQHEPVMKGPELMVTPAAAQYLGLALHELATNASKYGALDDEDGQLEVSWYVSNESGERCFNFTWLERSQSAQRDSRQSAGFGRTLLERIVAGAVEGDVTYEIADGEVRWSLSAPLDKIACSDTLRHEQSDVTMSLPALEVLGNTA